MVKTWRGTIFQSIIIVTVVTITFIPRSTSLEANWSGDEELWINRSFNFLFALTHGEWQHTFQSYHPGVITMWLGSISLWPKYQDLLFMSDFESSSGLNRGFSPISVENLTRMRMAMAIFLTIVILGIIVLLWKWLGWKIALVAAVFLAFDPTYLAESRKLHTDAPAASLITLTIISMIIHLEYSKRRFHLFLSGISFGLACLAKSSSIILAIYIPLLVLFYRLWNEGDKRSTRQQCLSSSLYTLLAWGGSAGLAFIGFWPAMWVAEFSFGPLTVPTAVFLLPSFGAATVWSARRNTADYVRPVELMILLCFVCIACLGVIINLEPIWSSIHGAMTTPHDFPQMYLGQVVYDPDWTYYTIMVTIYCTPLVLVLAFSGLLSNITQRNNVKHQGHIRIIIALWAFVVIEIMCLSIVEKKLSRYVLPVYPVLDILAAVSLEALIVRFSARLPLHNRKGALAKFMQRLVFVITSVMIIIGIHHLYTTVSLHPYYASYYNPLWRIFDIKKVTTVGRGVGIDKAASYLAQQKNSDNLIIRTSEVGRLYLSKYFQGTLLPLDDSKFTHLVDYDVVYIRDIQLGLNEVFYENRSPVKTIRANGEDYVYIFKTD